MFTWEQGPMTVFNAANDWSAPRTVVLERKPSEGFGFSVRGDSPVSVADMEEDSVAAVSVELLKQTTSVFFLDLSLNYCLNI